MFVNFVFALALQQFVLFKRKWWVLKTKDEKHVWLYNVLLGFCSHWVNVTACGCFIRETIHIPVADIGCSFNGYFLYKNTWKKMQGKWKYLVEIYNSVSELLFCNALQLICLISTSNDWFEYQCIHDLFFLYTIQH